jgi:hypothetical protein
MALRVDGLTVDSPVATALRVAMPQKNFTKLKDGWWEH